MFQELREHHARTDKNLTPELIQRILANYIDAVDAGKMYLLKSEVDTWLNASPERLEEIQRGYSRWQFGPFEEIDQVMASAIARRANWKPSEEKIELEETAEWAKDEEELSKRWQAAHMRFKELVEALPAAEREQAPARMAKRRAQWEAQFGPGEENERKRWVRLLKASASSLDDHTAYMTPQEAKGLQIEMEQKLVGIGIQLRDDMDLGYTVMRLLENGPAERSKQIKEGDRITGVNGKNVMGLEVDEVVERIRGPRGTSVELTLLRDNSETITVKLKRDEIELEGRQCEVSVHPYGNGVIGHISLHAFYTDYRGRSSSQEVADALLELKKNHRLLAVILDLRQNGGGLLGEALQVASIFLPQDVAVVVQDPDGTSTRVKSTPQDQIYDGPLLVLTSRASASGAEIVAQTLQETGRSLVVGDDHTFGKGSYQITSTQLIGPVKINPKGEFKVTRGFYYTQSGRTPQLEGVVADLVVPSPLAQAEVGEQFSRYPLKADPIQLSIGASIPAPPAWLEQLRANSQERLKAHTTYKTLVDTVADAEDRDMAQYILDFQLEEAFSIMKDLLVLKGTS